MHVCIIGAGIAGLAIARDLALRGITVSIIEKGTLGCETTTRCAGMLHSGSRYALKSIDLAKQCMEANRELNRLAAFSVKQPKGLVISLEQDSEEYADRFYDACRQAGIPIEDLSIKEALELEPNLSPKLKRAFLTPDGVFDPYALVEAHEQDIKNLGVAIFDRSDILNAKQTTSQWEIQINNRELGRHHTVKADMVVNAAGPGASQVAGLFGIGFPLAYIHGAILIFNDRYVNSLVTRCAPSTPGDVVTATGDMCLAAATSTEKDHNRPEQPNEQEISEVLQTAGEMIPRITRQGILHTFTGIRTHLSHTADNNQGTGFDIPRDFSISDHEKENGVNGIISVLGGKLILYRLVAELTGDMVVSKLGITKSCGTRTIPIPPAKNPTGRQLADRNH